jgi:HK97 gp10 family phage protein
MADQGASVVLQWYVHPNELTRRARRGAVNGLRNFTQEVLDLSQEYVPVVTGELKASGGSEVDPNVLEGQVFYSADYADWVENGTSRQAPQHFLSRAVAETVGRADAIFGDAARIELTG